MYRHGDVALTETQLPKDAIKVFSGKTYVLAEGEISGHKHVVTSETDFDVWEFAGGRFLVLHDSAMIDHQEHGLGTITPRTYKINIQREFDPFLKRLRKVVD